MTEEVLRIENLAKSFVTERSPLGHPLSVVRAVDGVSFSLTRGETLALVGESGSGKSTIARMIARLIEPDAGRIFFRGQNLLRISKRELSGLRPRIQMIFQDPYGSLNPRMRVGRILAGPLKLHRMVPRSALKDRVLELLEMVGLEADQLERYPHELSGGQRQRISIARAMALEPELVIADEPVSALDVSVRAQILNLLQHLQQMRHLTCLMISHDLSVVHHFAHRVAVLYGGKIVEMGSVEQVFGAPLHPYTEALLSAIPEPDPALEFNPQLWQNGSIFKAGGCALSHRCPMAEQRCSRTEPLLEEKQAGHWGACHLR